MQGRRLEDNTYPRKPGDYSRFTGVVRPPYGLRVEWFVRDPLGNFFALIPEVHSVVVSNDDGLITVSPSIVSPDGRYHGFLRHGDWS